MARCLVSSRPRRLATLAALFAVVGCGPGHDYELAPVRGTVAVAGSPLTAGRVMFAPVAAAGSLKSGKPGFGDLQPDGSFVVSSYSEGDGAVVADHWVSVIANTDEAKRQLDGASRVTYPKRLTVATGEENVFAIELSAEDVKRFGEIDD